MAADDIIETNLPDLTQVSLDELRTLPIPPEATQRVVGRIISGDDGVQEQR